MYEILGYIYWDVGYSTCFYINVIALGFSHLSLFLLLIAIVLYPRNLHKHLPPVSSFFHFQGRAEQIEKSNPAEERKRGKEKGGGED